MNQRTNKAFAKLVAHLEMMGYRVDADKAAGQLWRDALRRRNVRATEHTGRRFEVVALQPDEDCPGLWIGFKSFSQRDEALRLFYQAKEAE